MYAHNTIRKLMPETWCWGHIYEAEQFSECLLNKQ